MTITLVVKDDQGNVTLKLDGPRLPAANLTVPGFATPSHDLVLAAFARTFGFYRNK